MSKTSTDPKRHVLNGPTMGTRWSAQFFAAPDIDLETVRTALQAEVDAVDDQMSTWKAQSDLSRLNMAPPGTWLDIPDLLVDVLDMGLAIGRASGGAFDIGMGDAVTAWGFGPGEADEAGIRQAMGQPRRPAHELIDIDAKAGRVLKRADIALDLNGIAKGFGTDRLAECLAGFGIHASLVGIDGEMRASGLQPNALPWSIAVEAPEIDRRAPHSVLALEDAAVATSGDYRHWVEVNGHRLSHTMHPERGAPLTDSPASVTVVARSCAEADAWATAMMVLGPDKGRALAETFGLDVLFLLRDGHGQVCERGCGRLFGEAASGPPVSPRSAAPRPAGTASQG